MHLRLMCLCQFWKHLEFIFVGAFGLKTKESSPLPYLHFLIFIQPCQRQLVLRWIRAREAKKGEEEEEEEGGQKRKTNFSFFFLLPPSPSCFCLGVVAKAKNTTASQKEENEVGRRIVRSRGHRCPSCCCLPLLLPCRVCLFLPLHDSLLYTQKKSL